MEFFMDNWFVIFGILAGIIVLALMVRDWLKLPTEAQMDSVREWLLWAVGEAEEALGSGTGQRKLRMVYDMFLQRFPVIAAAMPFEVFADMVDEALERFEALLEPKAVEE